MDISRLKPVRISTYAKDKIVVDFFPELCVDKDIEIKAQKLSNREAPLHCGALCLYAALLETRLHETDVWALEPYCEERKVSLRNLVKNDAKYSNKTDEEIEEIVNDMIATDIRNCFAHGNFGISYDVYTKKMNFVLTPKRFDYVTPEPIVIDKKSIIKAHKEYLYKKGLQYSSYTPMMVEQACTTNLSKTLKSFIMPTQIQKLAEYYLSTKPISSSTIMFDQKIYYYAQYVLASAKITYEQQDYYDIFGRDSNIFKSISLIRNSLAHDNTEFLDNAKTISYADKRNSKTESIAESAIKLIVADSLKQSIMYVKENNQHSEQAVEGLKEKLKEIFDFFFDGTYKFEDVANAFVEFGEEQKTNEETKQEEIEKE